MTIPAPPAPPPPGRAPVQPRRRLHPAALVGIVAGAVILGLLLIGSCAAFVFGGDSTTAAPGVTVTEPGPTVTVTSGSGPAPTVTVTAKPAAPKTVEVPGPTVTKTVEVKPSADPSGPVEGVNEVGVDVKAGQWKSVVPEDSPGCYWARLRNDSGDFDSIITNENVDPGGRVSVTIKKSDKFFEIAGDCGEWRRS